MKHWRATFDDREHDKTWSEIFPAEGVTEAWGVAGKMTVSPEMIEAHGKHVTVLSVAIYREIMGPNQYGVPPLSRRSAEGEELQEEVVPRSHLAETNPCGICGREVHVILYYGVITREITWGLKDEDGERWVIHIQCHRRFSCV